MRMRIITDNWSCIADAVTTASPVKIMVMSSMESELKRMLGELRVSTGKHRCGSYFTVIDADQFAELLTRHLSEGIR